MRPFLVSWINEELLNLFDFHAVAFGDEDNINHLQNSNRVEYQKYNKPDRLR